MSTLKAVYALLSTREKRKALGVLALMFVTAFFELLGVGFILPFLSVAIDPGVIQRTPALNAVYEGLGFQDVTAFIVAGGVVMLGIIVVMNLISALTVWIEMRFVYHVGHSVAVRLMEHYLAKPYAFFLNQNTSELSKSILADTSKLVAGVLKPGAALLSRGIVSLAVVAFLVVVQPVISLLTMAVIGTAYATVYVVIRKKLERLGRSSHEANRWRYKTTAETFGGVKELKTLGRERYFLDEYERASLSYTSHQATNRIYSMMPRYLIQIVAFGGFMATFIALVASGRDLRDVVPIMGFFAFAAMRLLPGFQEILAAFSQFRFHEHLLFEIRDELASEPGGRQKLPDAGDPTPALPFNHVLRLEGVRFRYPGAEKDVIPDLTLEIPRNTSMALVGTTGAGKTTIVDIILGLLTPDAGRLTVDGIRVTPENAAAWRQRVGYVPQDVFLTDDTVARNIAYGVDDAHLDRQAVQRAATIAHIHDFIVTELPGGYDAVIGERGVRLSGGQRQRLGIARALYHDPDLLVLDEATSDVDTVTEAYITEAIQTLAGRKTLIIVAHRLATIQRCDRIFLLEAGSIVASGTYGDLAATSPGFRRMASVMTKAASVG